MAKARGDFFEVSRSQITLGAWASEWLSNQVQLKPTTKASYASIVRTAIVPKWGLVPLSALTHAGIHTWLSGETQRIAPRTVQSYHRVLSMILKYAVRDGRLSKNPADGVKLPRLVHRKHGYLTHAQVHELADRCGGDDADVVLFLAYTGLRWGEMAALRVQDIDMLRRRVNVKRAVAEVAGGLVYGTPKNHGQRSVPFPSFLGAMLASRCEGKTRDGLVFTAPAGGPLRNRNWRRRAFQAAMGHLVEAHPDVPTMTPHDLRHTAASLAISAGANVKAVQRMLGHASAAMTLDVYSDLFDDDLDAVGDALGQAGNPSIVGRPWAERPNGDAPVTAIRS